MSTNLVRRRFSTSEVLDIIEDQIRHHFIMKQSPVMDVLTLREGTEPGGRPLIRST